MLDLEPSGGWITLEYKIWDKVFKNEPSKICGRQPLKILLGPFLNTLSHILLELKTKFKCFKQGVSEIRGGDNL